jgi:hypothetical protein
MEARRMIACRVMRNVTCQPISASPKLPQTRALRFERYAATDQKAWPNNSCNRIYLAEILLVNSFIKACIAEITCLTYLHVPDSAGQIPGPGTQVA